MVVVLMGAVSKKWKMGSQSRPSIRFEKSFTATIVAGRKVTEDTNLIPRLINRQTNPSLITDSTGRPKRSRAERDKPLGCNHYEIL